MEALEKEQVERKKLLGEVCLLSQDQSNSHDLESVVKDNKDLLEHIIEDDEQHLLYCYVPKVACTNWKRLLVIQFNSFPQFDFYKITKQLVPPQMVLMGKANTTDPLSIVADDSHRLHVFRRLNNYTEEEIRYRLDHFLKFMFVRHPLERLLSAYRNKFNSNYSSSEYFRSRYGRQIVRQYRNNASEESLTKGHDVTFHEFVRYIIDPKTATASGGFNEHWKPMSDLCLPCTIRYNVIGKYETLMDDAWLVLEKAHLGGMSFPRSDRPSSTTSLVDEYMSQLTREELMHLYHIYELDFRLFDYKMASESL